MFGSRALGSNQPLGQRSFASGMQMNLEGGIGSSPFFGANPQQGNFVGAGSQGMQHFVGASQAGAAAGGGNFNILLQQPMGSLDAGPGFSGQSPNAGPGTHGQTDLIRTTFCPAFDHAEPDAEKLSTSLTRRLASLPSLRVQTPIRVEVRQRTAILRGTVKTAHDRALAEQLVRLEAGIESVENEIVVETSSPTKPPRP